MNIGLLFSLFMSTGLPWQVTIDDWSRIDAAVLTNDNYTYILSVTDRQIHQIGPDGKRKNSFGSSGHGPGEFIAPFRLFFLPASDQLLVVDGAKRKAMFFSRAGKFIRSQSIAPLQMQGLFFDHDVAIFTNDKLTVDKPNQGVSLFSTGVNSSGEYAMDATSWKKIKHFDASYHADPQLLPGQGKNFIRFPWTPRIRLAASPDGHFAYVGSNKELAIDILDVKKQQIVGVIRGSLKRPPLTKDIVQGYLDERRSQLGKAYRASHFKTPEYQTALIDFVVDRQGGVWVQRPKTDGQARFQHVSKHGESKGQLTLPFGSKIFAADENTIWLRRFDESSDAWVVEKRDITDQLSP